MSKKYILFNNILEKNLNKPLILSSSVVLDNFGINYTYNEEICGDGGAFGMMIDEIECFFANAKNIAIAHKCESAILCIDDISYKNLTHTKESLSKNIKLKDSIDNKLQQLGLHYFDDVEIVHILEILHDIIGLEHIESKISHKFSAFRGGLFFGNSGVCESRGGFGGKKSFEEKLENILKLFEVDIIKPKERYSSTFIEQLPINRKLSLKASSKPFLDLVDSGVDFITSFDSSAFVMFDYLQKEIERSVGREGSDMPFLHISQIVALGLGVHSNERLGLDLHKIKPSII